jgi:hypothetical protein
MEKKDNTVNVNNTDIITELSKNDSSVVIAEKKKIRKTPPPDITLSILTRYMKKQNMLLLKQIAELKNIEYDELKLDFLKPNYFTLRDGT